MRNLTTVLIAGTALSFASMAAFGQPAPLAAPTAPAKPAAGTVMTLVMRGLDKITGKATTVLIPIGKTAQYATLTITAKYCYTTPENETPETVAFVQIDDKRPDQPERHRVFSGWMYASTPGLHGLEHPLYDAWVMTCKAIKPGDTVVIGPTRSIKPVSPDKAAADERPAELPEGSGQ